MSKAKAQRIDNVEDRCYTIDDMADMLQTSRDRIYALIYSGKLKAISLLTPDEQKDRGRRNIWRIPASAYKDFLEQRSIQVNVGR